MATKRWNRRNLLSKVIGAIFKFFFGKYKIYSWRTKKIRTDWKFVANLILRDTIATITGEIRGFGEGRKWLHIKRHGTCCSKCETNWTKSNPHEFHHKKPLAAVQKVFFETPLRILPTFIVKMLANIIANRPKNIQLLCLRCHYEAHVLLGENGYTKQAIPLIRSKLIKRGIPVPRI